MLARDDERVERGLRIDVLEREDGVVFVVSCRGDLARDDLAEQTVGHEESLAWRYGRVDGRARVIRTDELSHPIFGLLIRSTGPATVNGAKEAKFCAFVRPRPGTHVAKQRTT